MNTRICSVIAVATLMALSTGCSGMRNFLFGRGARCGLCRSAAAPPPPAAVAPVPYAPMAAPCQAPVQGVVTAPSTGCGCGDYIGAEPVYSGMPCGECGVMSGCGCGDGAGSYGQIVNDPYLQGGSVGAPIVTDEVIGRSVEPIPGQPVPGQMLPGQVMPGQVVPGQVMPGSTTPLQPDDFSARKFDSDGNRILWEQPLPEGATSL